MPAFKVIAELTIHNLTSPGTLLPNRDDIYLTVEIFNQMKRSKLTDALFPIYFHERFVFEKMFWSAIDPAEVTEFLEDYPVKIELRQVTDVYMGGTLLAYFDSNAKAFFRPNLDTCPRFISDCECVMNRTVDFPGISPRIDVSTYVVVQSVPPYLPPSSTALNGELSSTRRSRSKSPSGGRVGSPSYERATVNSALRSRSPSPSARFGKSLESKRSTSRPVDDDLLSRTPGLVGGSGRRSRARSASPSRKNLDSEVETALARTSMSRPVSPTRSFSPSFTKRPASVGPLGDSSTEELKRRVDDSIYRSRMLRYPYYYYGRHYPYYDPCYSSYHCYPYSTYYPYSSYWYKYGYRYPYYHYGYPYYHHHHHHCYDPLDSSYRRMLEVDQQLYLSRLRRSLRLT